VAVIDEILAANDKYAAEFSSPNLPMPPARKVAVVVCMDARIDPERAFGLGLGEAHVIRNAGGRVSEAIRSLVISQALLGTEAVMVVHHVDCGMLTFNDQSLRDQLRKQHGADADAVAFLSFDDLDQSVRDDLQAYRLSPLVRQDIPVRGFVYDVNTGKLREIAA